MFKKNLALAICLGLSLTANTALAFNGEEEGEVASIGAQILDKAKSKFISAAGGQIASLFFDAIFGSSSGPSYVNLTEASLQAIQDRVHIEIVDSAEYQYIAAIESLELSIQYYSDTAQNGTPDVNVLGSLVINSNDLITHYSLNGQFNDEYYYLADSFSLVTSLSMAIYVERNIQGFITNASVKAKAYQLANQLQTLLDAKKSADLPLRERCEMLTSRYDQYEEELCTLKDPHGNTLDSYVISGSWYSEDQDDWDILKETVEIEYYAERFSEIEDVIYKLRNF